MRITSSELRAAAAATRRSAKNTTTGGGSWICLPQPGLTRRWDVVADGEGSMIAASVHRAVAEHVATWDPNVVLAIADLLDEAADQYEAATPTDTGLLYDARCGGIIHAGQSDPNACHCLDAVMALVKTLRRGAQ